MSIITLLQNKTAINNYVFTIIYAINSDLIADSKFLHILCKSVIRFYTDTNLSKAKINNKLFI
jgi:hypothetical protein